MRLRRLLPLIGLVLAVSSRPAFADATLFLGDHDTDQSTPKGFAVGAAWSSSASSSNTRRPRRTENAAPSLKTGQATSISRRRFRLRE
jgi:hypothetical protein